MEGLPTDRTREELLLAIGNRSSRRAYVPRPLDEDTADALRVLIAKYNNAAGLNMWLVTGDGGAFASARKTYGFFSGVKNYIAFVQDPDDAQQEERYGYYGQLLILEATLKGLGTCWVGGTFDRAAVPLALDKGRFVPCVITIGDVADELNVRERAIKRITHRRGSKTIEQMSLVEKAAPDWFTDAMKAVQKAPSAVNRQPVVFSLKDDVVTATVRDINAERVFYDLGIAKLHFVIGAGGGSWEWGNGGAFKRGAF